MKNLGQLILGVSLIWSANTFATLSLFTNQAAWENAIAPVLQVDYFSTSRGSIGLANELGGYVSGTNVNIGRTLTFDSANTGLANSFRITAQESGAKFTYYDSEGDSSFNHALSVGDIDDYENDNWIMEVLDGPAMYGFGFYLIDNNSSSGETLRVNGTEQISLTGLAHNTWVYVASTNAITSVRHDEKNDPDDIGLKGFRFAHSVPAPAGPVILALGLLGIGLRRRLG